MRTKVIVGVAGMLAIGAWLASAAPVASAQEGPMISDVQLVSTCGKACCQPACPPCIQYKGCPAPCSVEKVVTACKPCGCTVQLTIKTPANGCERVRTHRDGDVRYEYGRYGVHLDWRDRGNKLVVRYHG